MRSVRNLVVVLAVGASTLLASCDNSCQQICDRMARYAEECDIEVSKEDIQACKDAQAGSNSSEDRAACRENNSGSDIRDEWECSELRAYFNEVSSDAPESDTDG